MTAIGGFGGYETYLLVQGFPGKSRENGGLGWSSVVLLRGNGRNILVDTGSFSARKPLLSRLSSCGLTRMDVTDVVLTHSHYDHMMNWTLFPKATVRIAKAELDWALKEDPIETSLCAELYVQSLAASHQVHTFDAGDEVLPGLRTLSAPGHTPFHIAILIEDAAGRLILAADAVKNRAEFLAERAVSTMEEAASTRSIQAIKALWREREGTLLVCGHDLPMLNRADYPVYVGERRAGITAWLEPSLDEPTQYDLV